MTQTKKISVSIISVILLTYCYLGLSTIYDYYNDEIKIVTYGNLSEIANNILPVQLKTPESGTIKEIRHVCRDGKDLFLFGDNRLLHFDTSGEFINQIDSTDDNTFITGFALDSERHQVIVIDSERNVSRYNYDGTLIAQAKIRQQWRRISAIASFGGYLWASAEVVSTEKNNPKVITVSQNLYQLDDEMNIISSRKLQASAEYGLISIQPCISELAIGGNDEIYAYAPPANFEKLLDDTLNIIAHEHEFAPSRMLDACIYPVRKGKRFMISTNMNNEGNTFCYDRNRRKAYQLKDGFYDDVFGNGYVQNMQPTDIYNKCFCFIKSGRDIEKSFPNTENPVLFIVTLNS